MPPPAPTAACRYECHLIRADKEHNLVIEKTLREGMALWNQNSSLASSSSSFLFFFWFFFHPSQPYHKMPPLPTSRTAPHRTAPHPITIYEGMALWDQNGTTPRSKQTELAGATPTAVALDTSR